MRAGLVTAMSVRMWCRTGQLISKLPFNHVLLKAPRAVSGVEKQITTSAQLCNVKFGRGKNKHKPKMTAVQFQPHIEPPYTTRKDQHREIKWTESVLDSELAEMRHKFPEFLPPDDVRYRTDVAMSLERQDMLRRREHIDIPEFYVGSIMAVTVSDPHAPGKVSRFVGICIDRGGNGLRAYFVLRNYVDHEGIEIRYEIYNPTIRDIDVLRLEKRLDEHLYYLRDAEPQFSTFAFDMDTEPHPEGQPVPINPLRVKMKPWPWSARWEVQVPIIRGFEKLENVPDWYYNRSRASHNKLERFDLMLEYRTHITEEDQLPIWQAVKAHEDQFSEKRKQDRRRRFLLRNKEK